MKCRRVREVIGPYVYGDLTPREMMEVRLHAQGCAECAYEISAQSEIVAGIDDTMPALTDEEKQSIVWSVRGAVRAKQQAQKPLWLRLAPAAGLAGVLAIGFWAGAFFGSHSDKSPPGTGPSAEVQVTERQSPDVAANAVGATNDESGPAIASDGIRTFREENEPRTNDPRYRHRRPSPLGTLPMAVGSPVHRSRRTETRDGMATSDRPLKVVPSQEEKEPEDEARIGHPEPQPVEAEPEIQPSPTRDGADVSAVD